jgi:MSHA pilin protein MshB
VERPGQDTQADATAEKRWDVARGFSLIELVLVIVVLGILAAVALPRLSNLSDAAHRAKIAATASAFQSAAILVQTTRIALGLPRPTNNVPNFGLGNIDVNYTGYPSDTTSIDPANNNIVNDNKCVNLMNGLLEGPPTVTTSASAFSTAVPHTFRAQAMIAEVCRFTYRPVPTPLRYFEYNITTGRVTATNP